MKARIKSALHGLRIVLVCMVGIAMAGAVLHSVWNVFMLGWRAAR